MKTKNFSFNLPQELIAQYPSSRRGDSRLLFVNRRTGSVQHLHMSDFPNLLEKESILIMNNSKVTKARIFAESERGKAVEFLLIRKIKPREWECMVKQGKKQKPGSRYFFPEGISAQIGERGGLFRRLIFSTEIDEAYLERNGIIPLPPYIKREAEKNDEIRYQTVYGRESGSVASPTAGLHFTPEIINEIQKRGIRTCELTLHVGPGTFLPVRRETVEDHTMHTEYYSIPEETAAEVNEAIREHRPIVAIGTTSVRCLEASYRQGYLRAGTGTTDIFIYPGYEFQVVNRLFTNFHTPASTLIMLVCAFGGYENIMNAYKVAVDEKYRFFSYGDAMFIGEKDK